MLLQPSRAIPRKNVPAAVEFATELAALEAGRVRLWITGPAEDGYDIVFARILAEATIPITVGRAPSASDAYAAADLVVYPSTWEGFGNPVIESIAHRRPIAVGNYPVLDELRAFGVELLSVEDPEGARAWLLDPRPEVLEANVEHVRPHCSITDLPQRLARRLRERRLERVVTAQPDPVVERRARIARVVTLAKRVGYVLLLGAVVAFVVAAVAGFPNWAVTVTIVALLGACVVLPIPIVLGYGLRAAEREDREQGQGGMPGAARQ